MRIILTRNGETISNKQKIFMGHLPGILSEKGKEQAKKLALRLKDEEIDYIFSSDLTRASDTAKEIAKFYPNVPIEFTKEMRERNLGELQGVPRITLGDPSKVTSATVETEEGETKPDLYNRAKNFINELIERYPDKTILLVGHHAINLALTDNILGKPFENYTEVERQGNCAINIFKLTKGKKTIIELWDDTDHLN